MVQFVSYEIRIFIEILHHTAYGIYLIIVSIDIDRFAYGIFISEIFFGFAFTKYYCKRLIESIRSLSIHKRDMKDVKGGLIGISKTFFMNDLL